jgi:3-oxoacyl-[acyl-carrier protein] reductase
VKREFGAVDVLVHSAGGSGLLEPDAPGDDPLDAVAHAWTVNFRLNTLTAVLLTEALKPRLAEPGGRVLFLGSIAAYRGSGSGAYAAAKAGLHPYAHALARALGPRGITVNVVAPGYIEDTEFFGDAIGEERRARLVGETSNGRAGTPGGVAGTLHWLASPAAGHITSQIIQVNGGAERGHRSPAEEDGRAPVRAAVLPGVRPWPGVLSAPSGASRGSGAGPGRRPTRPAGLRCARGGGRSGAVAAPRPPC